MNNELLTSIENPTLVHFRHFSSLLTIEDPAPASPAPGQIGRNGIRPSLDGVNRQSSIVHRQSSIVNRPSTSVERALQINSFLTNKANFPDDQMNVTVFYTKDYENIIAFGLRKNKANTKPIKANTKPIKANTNPIQTQSNPISLLPKSPKFTAPGAEGANFTPAIANCTHRNQFSSFQFLVFNF